jgi:iron complex outermembrane receptor protein
VKYSPFKMLTLRGTFGKGFRAPNPAESGKAAALFGGLPFNDAVLCPHPGTAANPTPTAAGNFPNQCNLGVIGLQVATPTLQPEKSRNYTAGFIFQPFDSTSISFDYWDIKVNQDIQSGTAVFVLSGFNLGLFPVTRGAPATLPFCVTAGNCTGLQSTTIYGPGIGPVAYQPFPYFNATQTHVNGLDMDLLSHFDIGNAGRLSAQLNASYMFHYIFGLQGSSFDLAGTHGPSIISGDTGNPKIRATASLAWDVGPVNVTASLNYVGRFNLIDPTAGEPDCNSAIANGGLLAFNGRWPNGVPQSILNSYCEVRSFTDVDLYAQYAFSKNFAVHASILNVFGQDPPIDLTTYGASGNDPYNPAMHQAGAVGRFFNVGGTYTF